MACGCAHYHAFSPSTQKTFSIHKNATSMSPNRLFRPPQLSSVSNNGGFYNTLVSEAVRLLVPPARFEASKLKVVFLEEQSKKYSKIIPRTYILSHCDFTGNLTLSVTDIINNDQLRGWYKKDDVVAEWWKGKDSMRLHVHCYVSGPSRSLDLAAEFRYHIFSKELPLVLKAMVHGDSELFEENPELMNAYVWVYFHSSSPKYNRAECWGPLSDAAKGRQETEIEGFFSVNENGSGPPKKWKRPKSIFQALFAFLF